MAYKSESRKSALEQVLRAARTQIERDVRLAGFGLPSGVPSGGTPTGFATAASANLLAPLIVTNGTNGAPDTIAVFFADATAVTRSINMDDETTADIDDASTFAVGDLVVITNPRTPDDTIGSGGPVVEYDACVVAVTQVDTAPAKLHFANTGSPYNTASNLHCTAVKDITNTEAAASQTMIYRFVGRAYRIDPTRRDISVLQLSPSGGLIANDWTDLAIGFTNLQIATRYFEPVDGNDVDGDGDPTRDWYSSEDQETTTGVRPVDSVILQLSLSLAVRTSDKVTQVASAATPGFIDSSNAPESVNHNRLGDSPPVTLAGVADASRPLEHRGNHIYRFSSQTIDLRNLGIGR